LTTALLGSGCQDLVVTLTDDTIGDADGDGWLADEDCDDTSPYANLDDVDGDGWSTCDEDCDDNDAARNPGDLDGDGYSSCHGDCDDDNWNHNPGATELCDGLDNDCNGQTDEGPCVDCDHTLGPGGFIGIQQAVMSPSVEDDDAICVPPGQYYEKIDLGPKKVRIYGLAGPYLTVVDAGGEGSVARIITQQNGDSWLQGLTLQNGEGNDGGGLFVEQSSPMLKRLVVQDNHVTGKGGGVYIHDGEPTLDSVLITHNTSGSDGGGLAALAAGVTMVSVQVSHNTATGPGGGIHLFDSETAHLSHVSVTGNNTGQDGGGLALLDTAVQFDQLVVRGNKAQGRGGGLFLAVDDSSYGNGIVAENTAHGSGGGVSTVDATTALTNLFVVGNRAASGGGIHLVDSSPTMRNLDVVGNEADDSVGGGLLVSGDSEPQMVNLAIVGNRASSGGGGVDGASTPSISHTNCWGNQPADYHNMSDPTGELGNISLDPGYGISDTLAAFHWNLHLPEGSPQHNGGDPALSDPDGARSSIGAYGGELGDDHDLDNDGALDWWTPGPYPGGALDCDDRRPYINPVSGC